jgi:regulator of protease activity HflC (stomatin/prohibitin superfamily)
MKDSIKVIAIVLASLVVVVGLMVGIPKYTVWRKEMKGKATLAEAEWDRQVKVREASAMAESAVFQAEAEVERAKGVAQANEIIGGSLKGNSEYLRYLWIQSLSEGKSEVIYVPTETNLPILEAARLKPADK